MYRFARQPRWVVGHVLVAVLAVVMVGLGTWQLGRLEERRAHNALLAARSAAATVALDDLLAEASPEEAEFRWATVAGTFDAAAEVLVRNRELGGQTGFDVLTPLVPAAGDAVIVNRGWVPMAVGERWPEAGVPPPGGVVEVTAMVRLGERRRGLAVADPADGVLTEMGRVDLDRLARQLPYPIRPVALQATTTAGTGWSALPAPHPVPDRGEGSHLSYAIQWFAFSAIAVVGWVALLRRTARTTGGSEGPGRPSTSGAELPPTDDGRRAEAAADRARAPAG